MHETLSLIFYDTYTLSYHHMLIFFFFFFLVCYDNLITSALYFSYGWFNEKLSSHHHMLSMLYYYRCDRLIFIRRLVSPWCHLSINYDAKKSLLITKQRMKTTICIDNKSRKNLWIKRKKNTLLNILSFPFKKKKTYLVYIYNWNVLKKQFRL